MNAINRQARSLFSNIWMNIGYDPRLFFLCNRLRSSKRGDPVDHKTEAVIEGYQRTGNHFAFLSFIQAQSRPIRVAHHLHAPAQIIKAAKLNIPSLLLTRRPADVVCSQVLRAPYISVEMSLKSYIGFYQRTLPYQDAYVVGLFDEVISDMSAIISRINCRFGTHYELFVHSKENIDRVFSRINKLNQEREGGDLTRISRPSSQKQEKKTEILRMLAQESAQPLLSQAKDLYDVYCELSKRR